MKKLLFLLPLAPLACQPKHTPDSPTAPDVETAEVQPEPENPMPTGDPSEPATYIGLSLPQAEKIADDAGLRHRVIRMNGEDRMVTRDYLPDRLNFTVENDKVSEVTKG